MQILARHDCRAIGAAASGHHLRAGSRYAAYGGDAGPHATGAERRSFHGDVRAVNLAASAFPLETTLSIIPTAILDALAYIALM